MSRNDQLTTWLSNHPRTMDALWTMALLAAAVGPALASGGGGTSGP